MNSDQKTVNLSFMRGMKLSGRSALFAAALLLTAVAMYVVGVRVGKGYTKHLDAALLASVQADLSLNKLLRLRELEKDLAAGCSTEVLQKIRNDIDSEMALLSSLYMAHRADGAMESVSRREPGLANALAGFKSTKGSSWTEPKCAK